jgi:hypothetical protein
MNIVIFSFLVSTATCTLRNSDVPDHYCKNIEFAIVNKIGWKNVPENPSIFCWPLTWICLTWPGILRAGGSDLKTAFLQNKNSNYNFMIKRKDLWITVSIFCLTAAFLSTHQHFVVNNIYENMLNW